MAAVSVGRASSRTDPASLPVSFLPDNVYDGQGWYPSTLLLLAGLPAPSLARDFIAHGLTICLAAHSIQVVIEAKDQGQSAAVGFFLKLVLIHGCRQMASHTGPHPDPSPILAMTIPFSGSL